MGINLTDWITAITSTITAFTILLIWKQIRADHERSRRDKAVDLMQFMVNKPNLAVSSRPVVIFVEQLTEKQCECLQRLEPFEVNRDLEDALLNCLLAFDKEMKPQIVENKILLGKRELILIRSSIITYLNCLEIIATAWRHNIVDRDIIEEELVSILSPKKNRFVLEAFRLVTGIYPSIAEFVEALKKKQNIRVSKKPII